jgi:hypothetical protein
MLRPQVSEIAPAEALLCAVGVDPIISHAVEPITDDQLRFARDISTEIDKKIHALVYGNSAYEEPVPRPYFNLLSQLSQKYQPHQVEAMLASIPPELGMVKPAFTAAALNAFQYLQGALPRQTRDAIVVSGNRGNNLLPTKGQLHLFNTIHAVLQSPLSVFALVANARVSPKQVESLLLVYPTLTAYMTKSLLLALLDRKTKELRWNPTNAMEKGVKIFLRIPPDPALQAASAMASTPTPAPQHKLPAKDTPNLAQNETTSVEQARSV